MYRNSETAYGTKIMKVREHQTRCNSAPDVRRSCEIGARFHESRIINEPCQPYNPSTVFISQLRNPVSHLPSNRSFRVSSGIFRNVEAVKNLAGWIKDPVQEK